jgi:hypothetical protein
VNDADFREHVRELLGQSDEQQLRRMADQAEGEREERFAKLTAAQKAAVFLQAFDKYVPVLLEEIQKNATRPIPTHEPGRRNPFHVDHNDEERRDLRIGQHVLTVITCGGDIEAEVTYLPDDKEWSIPVNEVSERGAQELLWTFAQLGLGL